jgi:PAP2 superfamily protein
MTAVAAVGRRYLPRGWGDFARQLSIWFGFLLAYQVARGIADRDPARAFENGWRVLGFEQGITNDVFELTLQRAAESSALLNQLASLTYWTSEFAVVGIALLWVYLRRHESFRPFRNWILLANVLGLVGYVLLPTAPPRMFQSLGFIDTLGSLSSMNHGSGLVEVAPNPYAAMPSLHAADALIVGIVLMSVTRRRWLRLLWAVWPLWVWFCVMATANHFWLDIVAGVAVALLALAMLQSRRLLRLFPKLA